MQRRGLGRGPAGRTRDDRVAGSSGPRNRDVPAPLSLQVLGVEVTIDCADAESAALLAVHYASMQGPCSAPALRYAVVRRFRGLVLSRGPAGHAVASDPGDLLLRLDGDLAIQVQRRRPRLYFVHAGVLLARGHAFMLVAPSGGGKSTTCWALAHHGCAYLSDELAPLDLATLTVHSYPRALTLKRRPPPGYPLPAAAVSSSRGYLLGACTMPGGVATTAAPLMAIFFLCHPRRRRPRVERITPARAGARLYANALNPLAHPGDGLEAAVRVAGETACFELSAADLPTTCAVVRQVLAALAPPIPVHALPATAHDVLPGPRSSGPDAVATHGMPAAAGLARAARR